MSGADCVTADVDLKMLLWIIQKTDVKIDYDALANELSDGDVVVSPQAVAKHLSRLKTKGPAVSDLPIDLTM